ncbi:7-carboxy-7-deazaguanine synthase QueE [Bacteroidales bacterium OttesenSCG-928-M11]|nr:7-carboxy-7-deazaguanine synthase QueE [Bacteroidales bacterium OttesenSCG-928-M11]
MNLKIKEIFYSLQGEGGRQGEASIFIRLAGCNLNCDFCDTDFESDTKDLSLNEIANLISNYPARWIIWTGGEPTLQLKDEIFLFFKQKGYLQAIESNGTNPLSSLLDYRVVSPKGNYLYAREINPQVEEIRLPVQDGALIPDIKLLPTANHYYLSPIFAANNNDQTRLNINYCVQYILDHPIWKLSLQIHKLIGIE